MVMQQATQETALPPQFGEWLAETTTGLPGRKHKARQMKQEISRFERDIEESEQLVNFALVGFVELVRQAGQDDDAARKFDEWTDDLDLAQTLAMYEEMVVPGLKERASILHKIVGGWHRMADAGLIEPDLPPQLTERAAQLDTCIRELTAEITKREDNELITRLLIRVGNHRPLSPAEKIRLSDAIRRRVQVRSTPSERRSDWYGDDGR